MARADLPQNLIEALQEVGMSPVMDQGAVWNCRGTPVVLHKALERIAHKKGIRFDPPMVIETSAEQNIAVMCVTGYLGEFSEWSIGESTPRNTTNNYPFAMAEKRAKDRVILKLIGVAGFVYSEEEADEFKDSKPQSNQNDNTGFNPNEQKARDFLRDVHMKCSPANMKTSNDFERLVSPDYFAGCMREAKEHAPEVFAKIEEELAQAARRLKLEW
jgi:hypothetical protein